MSYPDWYKRVSRPFRSSKAAHALVALDKGLVALVALAYGLALAQLAVSGDAHLWKCLAVPAFTFALVSALRALLDWPRPYNVFGIEPIIAKKERGKTFPSRHVASAVVIACALFWLNPIAGAFALVASATVAATRIIGGVHFPRDVIAAVVIAATCAAIGFIALP